MANPSIYTVGGTVQAGGGIYIPRQADEELLGLCRSATFAYVLTPRQMGKSSLMVRTAETLREEGIRSVIVDLQELGANVTAEQWYFGFLVKLDDQLMFDTDVVSWWQEHQHLGVSQRLTLFFERVLLAEVEGQVVIFVDEIDSTLSLDFTDDFFIAIRYLYVARATNPEFHRLSFVLIGVATPGDLIRDAKRTPFNIGQRVDLTDFTFEEALPLANGLRLPMDKAQLVLMWVLQWTEGHPYLTQRLCNAITDQGNSSWSKVYIEGVVHSTFFGAMSEQDNNLQFVRDMLTKRSPDQEVLTTYREIYRSKLPVLDEEQSLVKSHLKLSGVVRRENGKLLVRNLIYSRVFDEQWIIKNLPPNYWRIYQKIFYACSVGIGIGVFGSLTVLELANFYQEREVRQFNQGYEQAQLLSNYKDAVVGAQLHSSNLVAVLENSQQLQSKKADFLNNVEKAKQLESKIGGFIESKPRRLAATSSTLQTLLLDYKINLKAYIDQIEAVLQKIDSQQVQPQQISSARSQLLTIMRGETAIRLDQLSQSLTNILQTAEEQEQERQKAVEQAKVVQRAILTLNAVVLVPLAVVMGVVTSQRKAPEV
ncbi:AAA-like domain-containing protein [Nostoc sp. DedQUE09]|uniref:AAA-like domain-containing protein n=1 Tax=Nostoc sp. DedQUE09 TaxID=3075394 RepID=UPI002AD39DBE|nr:AAA-like domain-containing protein [Nostoc sp. DedQUE09]MDZ7954554.1 AAA-like domain-containing protein [Nostoc sp. DedQUE09]